MMKGGRRSWETMAARVGKLSGLCHFRTVNFFVFEAWTCVRRERGMSWWMALS